MRLHTDRPHISATSCYLRVPVCPYCGEMLLAPEQSEFVDGGEVRHYWSCDSCGRDSQTSVAFTAHQGVIPKSGTRFPAFAKPASAGEGRSDKITPKN